MALTIAHAARVLAPHLLLVLAVLACPVASAAQRAGPVPADDPFARRGWHLELAGHGALEAWNYNISHEEMVALVPGFTYGLRDGLQFIASWPMYFVSQRGVDAYLVGATFGVRGRVYRRERWTAFLELKVGISDADTYVPPRGTRFNYLALGGGGLTLRLHRGIHGLAGLEWIHVSNGGHAGRSRNPDIEAIGPRVGVLIAF
jgi:opacity protein-like surface antigen